MKLRKMLVLNEKYEDRYIILPDDAEGEEQAFCDVLKERIKEGYYYSESEAAEAATYIAFGKAKEFLASRQQYEYEGFNTVNGIPDYGA